MQLITDEQANEDDIPNDWTWVQTDILSRSRWSITERSSYRTRDGFYYIDRIGSSSGDGIGGNGWEVTGHGVAKQVKTIVYEPLVAP